MYLNTYEFFEYAPKHPGLDYAFAMCVSGKPKVPIQVYRDEVLGNIDLTETIQRLTEKGIIKEEGEGYVPIFLPESAFKGHCNGCAIYYDFLCDITRPRCRKNLGAVINFCKVFIVLCYLIDSGITEFSFRHIDFYLLGKGFERQGAVRGSPVTTVQAMWSSTFKKILDMYAEAGIFSYEVKHGRGGGYSIKYGEKYLTKYY